MFRKPASMQTVGFPINVLRIHGEISLGECFSSKMQKVCEM